MSSQPPPRPPIALSDCLRNNNIEVREEEYCHQLTANQHFGKVGPREDSSHQISRIDVEALEAHLRSTTVAQTVRLAVDAAFFPPCRFGNAGYYKVTDATLETGEMSLQPEPLFVKEGQQHERPEGKAQTQALSFGQASMPPPTQSRLPESNTAEQTSAFLQELLPHTTFWLTRPSSLKFVAKLGQGVADPVKMFPYLTVVWQEDRESEEHCRTRGALIAACILSSHVKMLRKTPGIQHIKDLSHYVISIEGNGSWFNVSEAKPSQDGSGYVTTWLEAGVLPLNLTRFDGWVNNIHDWAIKVWKPMVIAAYSPEYLTYPDNSSEVNDNGAEREARAAANTWG